MRYIYKSQHRYSKKRTPVIDGKNTDSTASSKIIVTPNINDYDLSDPFWYFKYADDTRQLNEPREEEDDWPGWSDSDSDDDLPF